MTNTELDILPSRLESFAKFKERTSSNALVLVPNNPNLRQYGANPYTRYDSGQPFLYRGETPEGIKPLERVVSLKDKTEAWSLPLLQEKGKITTKDGTILKWEAGQNSALDTTLISAGKDVGNVTAVKDGEDQIYFVDFAFAFHAFHPNAVINIK